MQVIMCWWDLVVGGVNLILDYLAYYNKRLYTILGYLSLMEFESKRLRKVAYERGLFELFITQPIVALVT